MTSTRDRFLADPENKTRALHYGQGLERDGDPRGRLMQLQAHGEHDKAEEWLHAHLEVFLGPNTAWCIPERGSDERTPLELAWRHGFIRALYLGLQPEDFREGLQGPELLAEILAHPSTTGLRELELGDLHDSAIEERWHCYDRAFEALERRGSLPTLRSLQLGLHQSRLPRPAPRQKAPEPDRELTDFERSVARRNRGDDPLAAFLGMKDWTAALQQPGGVRGLPGSARLLSFGRSLAGVCRHYPDLRRLGLHHCVDVAVDGLDCPALEELTIGFSWSGVDTMAIEDILRARLPALRTLRIDFGTGEQDVSAGLLAPLWAARRNRFPRLAEISLDNFADLDHLLPAFKPPRGFRERIERLVVSGPVPDDQRSLVSSLCRKHPWLEIVDTAAR